MSEARRLGETDETPARRLRRAATLMREQHAPDHERHEMWSAMETLLFMAADHTDGRGNTCGSCVGQAVAVADAYLDAVTPPAQQPPTTDGADR